MNILAQLGCDDLATVTLAEFAPNRRIEFVESVQPPTPREQKWVVIISTLFGCPVQCAMCDAGSRYDGKLSAEQMLAQIDHCVDRRYADRHVPSRQFKIQFARMGEPAFNPAVLDVLNALPTRYDAPGLMPSISTIAPTGCDSFFDRLIEIKRRLYSGGQFQMQFSIHSSDVATRDRLMPVKKWSFDRIASFAERFIQPGDRKITLNFALARGIVVDAEELRRWFDPSRVMIKITPINPNCATERNNIVSYVDVDSDMADPDGTIGRLGDAGYDVLVSVGEVEENRIGSNCGQYVTTFLQAGDAATTAGAYTYPLQMNASETPTT